MQTFFSTRQMQNSTWKDVQADRLGRTAPSRAPRGARVKFFPAVQRRWLVQRPWLQSVRLSPSMDTTTTPFFSTEATAEARDIGRDPEVKVLFLEDIVEKMRCRPLVIHAAGWQHSIARGKVAANQVECSAAVFTSVRCPSLCVLVQAVLVLLQAKWPRKKEKDSSNQMNTCDAKRYSPSTVQACAIC